MAARSGAALFRWELAQLVQTELIVLKDNCRGTKREGTSRQYLLWRPVHISSLR